MRYLQGCGSGCSRPGSVSDLWVKNRFLIGHSRSKIIVSGFDRQVNKIHKLILYYNFGEKIFFLKFDFRSNSVSGWILPPYYCIKKTHIKLIYQLFIAAEQIKS